MRVLGLTLMLAMFQIDAAASEAATGTFVASRSCDAYLSFRKGINPGTARTAPGAEYDIHEVNDKDRAWLRVEMRGINEPLRWVAAECGVVKGLQPTSAGLVGGTFPASGGQCNVAGRQDSYVLAVSWQPGFCEHVKYDGIKPECDRMADGSLVVSNLTVHGLWPNLHQCGTKYGSCGDSDPELSEDTISYISPWMPNFFYERVFGNYEWKKHGTCSGMNSDMYFRRAVDSVKLLNESAAGRYLTENIGGRISKQTFVTKLKAETGRDQAANAFTLLCSNKQLIEIRVRLPLDFKEGGSLNDLLGSNLPSVPISDAKECKADEILIEASGK